jgi:hypothetical protein
VPFAPGERKAKVISMPSVEDVAPSLSVEAVVVRGDGSVFIGVPRTFADPVWVVRDRDGDFRMVSVRLLAGARLADHGVMAVRVQLLDSEQAEIDAVTFTESRRDAGSLLVPIELGVVYRVTRYGLDASAQVGGVEESLSSEILIPVVVANRVTTTG